MSKQSLLHGGSLLKPPLPSKQGRHSLGIRNGGLDFVKAAVSVFRAWRLPAERRLFFFCRRPADVDKKFSKVDCNYNSLIVSVIAKLRMRFAGA